jgi:hypothetical protein
VNYDRAGKRRVAAKQLVGEQVKRNRPAEDVLTQ